MTITLFKVVKLFFTLVGLLSVALGFFRWGRGDASLILKTTSVVGMSALAFIVAAGVISTW